MHFHEKIDKKKWITQQYLKIKVKPLTFQHKNMFIVFILKTQVETYGILTSTKLVKFKMM